MRLLRLIKQNVDVCGTTVISKDVWLCEPILVHAFTIVVLFVCAHSFVEECLMHSCLEFVYVPVCSYGMYQPGKCARAFTIPGVNARTQRKYLSVFSCFCLRLALDGTVDFD